MVIGHYELEKALPNKRLGMIEHVFIPVWVSCKRAEPQGKKSTAFEPWIRWRFDNHLCPFSHDGPSQKTKNPGSARSRGFYF